MPRDNPNPLQSGLENISNILGRFFDPQQKRNAQTQNLHPSPDLKRVVDLGQDLDQGSRWRRHKTNVVSTVAAVRSKGEKQGKGDSPVSSEELGRSTWTLLHAIAAQYPDKPSKREQRDVKNLVESLSRVYPCAKCAEHFQEIIKNDPPRVESHKEFSQWMCHAHNVVNRSLNKPTFNCSLVGARWGSLDCGENDDSCKVDFGKKGHISKR